MPGSPTGRVLHALALLSFLWLLACDGAPETATAPSTQTDLSSEAASDTASDSESDPAPKPRSDPRLEAAKEILGKHLSERYPASLATILEKRFLRVVTSRNAFDYFLYRGDQGGYQLQMVRDFTAFLNERFPGDPKALPIQYELVPVDDDQLIPRLLEGKADLIAARLTITPERAERVAFSNPYRQVDEVLLTHDQTPPLDSAEALSGRTVGVRQSSSYHESLLRLNRALEAAQKPPVVIELVDEALESERIVELVAARRLPYTVVDSMIADAALPLHPSLRRVEGVVLREEADIAWATLPVADTLVEEMNRFLDRYEKGTLLGNMTYRRHFEQGAALAARIAANEEPRISAFDAHFREHAERHGMDWRLLAALACQESRFDPTRRNRSGAVGLMQIKPSTAREPFVNVPEVEGPEHVEDNITAGVRYLAWIKQRYFDSDAEMRERDRLRMAMAAYNAGPRTILRARARAEKMGLDPNRWFRNVERALLEMRKLEPVDYVSEINQRYVSYVMLGVE